MLQSISLSLEHIVHTTRSLCLRYNTYALIVLLMPLRSPLSVFLEYSLCPSLSLDLLWLLPCVWTKHHGCAHACLQHPPTLALSDLSLGCTLGFASFQMKQSHWWIGRQHREKRVPMAEDEGAFPFSLQAYFLVGQLVPCSQFSFQIGYYDKTAHVFHLETDSVMSRSRKWAPGARLRSPARAVNALNICLSICM